jgi:hypothetical protein
LSFQEEATQIVIIKFAAITKYFKKNTQNYGKVPYFGNTETVVAHPLARPGCHKGITLLFFGKQFLYVSLLMVLVGPFRDPFFSGLK